MAMQYAPSRFGNLSIYGDTLHIARSRRSGLSPATSTVTRKRMRHPAISAVKRGGEIATMALNPCGRVERIVVLPGQ
jgi:hypothetical protein